MPFLAPLAIAAGTALSSAGLTTIGGALSSLASGAAASAAGGAFGAGMSSAAMTTLGFSGGVVGTGGVSAAAAGTAIGTGSTLMTGAQQLAAFNGTATPYVAPHAAAGWALPSAVNTPNVLAAGSLATSAASVGHSLLTKVPGMPEMPKGVSEAKVLPQQDSEKLKTAKKRSIVQQRASGGRRSTMLSGGSGDSLGA